ncbi:hypothetical protein Tco_0309340 [Tanacetum coccineum]
MALFNKIRSLTRQSISQTTVAEEVTHAKTASDLNTQPAKSGRSGTTVDQKSDVIVFPHVLQAQANENSESSASFGGRRQKRRGIATFQQPFKLRTKVGEVSRDLEHTLRVLLHVDFLPSLLCHERIMNYGSDLLILSAYAPSMPPLLSLLLSMACDDSDGCVTMVIGSYAVKQANRLKLSRVVKAVITRILAGQPFRLAAMAGLYSLTCIVPGISSHFNLNTSHAFAVAVSIATFSFTVMVTRMGYVAMMEYNYGLDPVNPPGGFQTDLVPKVMVTNEGIKNVPAKTLKAGVRPTEQSASLKRNLDAKALMLAINQSPIVFTSFVRGVGVVWNGQLNHVVEKAGENHHDGTDNAGPEVTKKLVCLESLMVATDSFSGSLHHGSIRSFEYFRVGGGGIGTCSRKKRWKGALTSSSSKKKCRLQT